MRVDVERARAGAWCVLLSLSALVVWPRAEHPFSGPKLVVFAAGVVALALLASEWPKIQLFPRICLGVWAAGLAASTFVRGGAFEVVVRETLVIALVVLAIGAPPGRGPLRAVAWTSAAVAAIAILQSFGADPFGLFGLHPAVAGERMRIYSTLGNPDFLAAWLGAALWTCAREPKNRANLAILTIGTLALALCASYATVLAAAAGGVAWFVAERRFPKQIVLIGAALAMALVLAAAGSRSLTTRLSGRAALAKIALVNAVSSPLVGHGPGSFAEAYPAWRGDDPMLDPVQDHVHDDWLERAVEQGFPAALAFFALALGAFVHAVRARSGWLAAGMASLASRACVDFPFARVPELVLFAVFVGLSYHRSSRERAEAVP